MMTAADRAALDAALARILARALVREMRAEAEHDKRGRLHADVQERMVHETKAAFAGDENGASRRGRNAAGSLPMRLGKDASDHDNRSTRPIPPRGGVDD
jgi:hypothetical protein